MSSYENEKLTTQKFLEDAVNEGRKEGIATEPQKESDKLILDEISNEKPPDDFGFVDSSESGTWPLKSAQEDTLENLPEETESTESSRDSENEEEIEPQEGGDKTVQEQQQTLLDVILPENPSEPAQSKPNEALLKPTEAKEPPTDNLEETESTRDLKSCEKELSDEEGSKEPKEEWQNLLGSGVVMKKILREGEPDSRPVRSNKCLINYTCRLEDADEEDFAEKVENYELGLGEGDVVQGLDVAIGLMNKKERCLLKIRPRLAYGEKGLPPNIPRNATVMFDVELLDVQQEDEFESLNVQDRRKIGNKKRERGNWWYHRGENTLAIQCYRRALDFLDEVESENIEHTKPSDSELQQLLEDRLKVLNNMASAQIKMELHDQALTSLQTVLRCQPDNVKALYRKSKIYMAKNDLTQALKLLEKAKALEPEDALIAKEMSVVNSLINKQRNSEREYARRMFASASPTTSTSKTRLNKGTDKPKSSRIQVWTTIGATVIIGLAGVIAYKFKYP